VFSPLYGRQGGSRLVISMYHIRDDNLTGTFLHFLELFGVWNRASKTLTRHEQALNEHPIAERGRSQIF
jgi:hypothetical protein